MIINLKTVSIHSYTITSMNVNDIGIITAISTIVIF